MTIAKDVWEQVRQRARFACEYCGVTETDSAGPLSVDHIQPRSHGGTDEFSNLVYCCFRCNLYKADYWPSRPGDPMLWNPRLESAMVHFVSLIDGTRYPSTTTGAFTLNRLKLNRPALVAYRRRIQATATEARLLLRYQEVLVLLDRLHRQQAELLKENHALLEEQRTILNLLLQKFQD